MIPSTPSYLLPHERERVALWEFETYAAPVVRAPQVAGMSVQDKWTFDVTNIAEVYKARPDLCNIEIKRAEVNRAIAAGLRECQGLVIRQEVRTGVRA